MLMLMAANRHSLALKSLTAGNLSSSSSTAQSNSTSASTSSSFSLLSASNTTTTATHMHDKKANFSDRSNQINANDDLIIKSTKKQMMQNQPLQAGSTSFSGSSSGETVIEAQERERNIYYKQLTMPNGSIIELNLSNGPSDACTQKEELLKSEKRNNANEHTHQHHKHHHNSSREPKITSSKHHGHNHKHREHHSSSNHSRGNHHHTANNIDNNNSQAVESNNDTMNTDLTIKCDVGIQVDEAQNGFDYANKQHKSSNCHNNKTFSSTLLKSMNRLNPFSNGSQNQNHNQTQIYITPNVNQINQQTNQLGWYQTFAQRYLRRKSMQKMGQNSHKNNNNNNNHDNDADADADANYDEFQQQTSRSAPVTPVKWQMQRNECNQINPKSSLAVVITTTSPDNEQLIEADTIISDSSGSIQHSASRPSVRFADNGDEQGNDIRQSNSIAKNEDFMQDEDNDLDNDCLEEDTLEEEICDDEDFGAKKASEIVAKLFQFPQEKPFQTQTTNTDTCILSNRKDPQDTSLDSNNNNNNDNDNIIAELSNKLQENGECPMDSSHFRHYGYRLIDYICNYLDTIKERRVTPLNIEPGYLKSLIEPAAPEQGEPFPKIMQDFEKHIMCGITHWQHPHFHAYFPAGNAYPSILADMLSDALGCVGFSWAASPAYTELEIIMLDWMGKMIGLPDEFLCLSGSQESRGGGVIQGSASECVLVNLLAARHWAIERLRSKYPRQPDGLLLSKLIGYCSKEAHSCVEKAAMIGFIRMRALDTDENQSLRGETLARAIEADLEQGLEPFLVCATLGTTSCVSFDNLHELGNVCEKHDIWLHVDAAYAGSALICPEFKYLMKGIGKASSFNMNPNKWMLINFDCSLMWVKDRFKLTRAFVVDPLYLQHSYSDQAIDYRHWGIPLSRRFRALKLWFTIRNYGISGLQAYVRNHVKLAKLFEQLIKSDNRFCVTNQVVLGLVCFRLVGSNALNQRLLSIINASGKLHMVPASVNGRYVIRFCICDQNAREQDVRYAYECIANFATELIASVRAGKERFRAISAQNTVEMLASALPIGVQSPENVANEANNEPNNEACSTNTNNDHDIANDNNIVITSSPRSSGPASRLSQRSISMDSSRQATPCSASSIGPESTTAIEQLVLASPLSRRAQSAVPAPTIVQQSPSPINRPESRLGLNNNPNINANGNGKSPLIKQKSMLANDQQQQHSPDMDEFLDTNKHSIGCNSAEPSGNHHHQHHRGLVPFNKNLTIDQHCNTNSQDSEQFKTAQRRARVTSGRYKRKFFVRVVSDPRVYRASISGDINAHSSNGSLANNGSIVSNSSQISISNDTTTQPQIQTSAKTQNYDTANETIMQEEKSSNSPIV